MSADILAENIPLTPDFICPICLPKPKSSGFQWKIHWFHWESVVRGHDSLLFLTGFDFKLLEWIVKNKIHSKEIGPVVVADKKDDSNLNFVWDFVVTSIQFLKTTVGLIF